MNNNTLNRYLHVGMVHSVIFLETFQGKGPIVETAKKIIENDFFGAIEISWVKDINEREKLADLLKSSHMDVVFLAAIPILVENINLSSIDEAERLEAVEKVKKWIDEAYFFGAKLLLVGSGPDPGKEKRDEAKESLAYSLKELCEYAKRKAINYTLVVTMENYDRDVDKRFLIGPTVEAVEIAQRIREEFGNFGLTIDQSHLFQLRESPSVVLEQAKEYIVHVHLANCVVEDRTHSIYGDQHPRFGIEGGEVDVKEVSQFLKSLQKVGYFTSKVPTSLPVISLEVKPLPGENSDVLIAASQRVFKEAWARLDF